MKRRDFILSSPVMALGSSILTPSVAPELANKPVLRLAHFTDTHIESKGPSAQGVAAALQKIQSLKERPTAILLGGDMIFDGLKRDKTEVKKQWELWQRVLHQENTIPTIGCIGNHDVWGWGIKGTAIDQDDLYGKKWAIDELKMPARYYSFEQAGWHFIVLDSVHLSEEHDYQSKLDDVQFEWLKDKLKSIPARTPVCVLSHSPIVSFASSIFTNTYLSEEFGNVYRWGLMHTDVIKIKDLFFQHPNIKLCLAGHLHMQERVEYLGIKYVCGGAVSGNWWNGSRFEFPPAFTLVDLFADGSSSIQFVPY